MKWNDHIYLAKNICKRRGERLSLYAKIAYTYGNAEPDFNVLTFLHGKRKGEKIRRHNFEKLKPVVEKLTDKLAADSSMLRYSYRLGKLSHYVADMYTILITRCSSGRCGSISDMKVS